MDLDRRLVLTMPLALAACGGSGRDAGRPAAPPPPSGAAFALADAVAGDWRPPEEKARDRWRHPVETLTFLGVKPGMTVIELWPGAGWYTAILAPFLARTGGRLVAAGFETHDPATPDATRLEAAFRARLAQRPDLFGQAVFSTFGPRSGPLVPPGTADMVLTFRNLHNWMAGGFAEKAFHDAAAALKPGGLLGLEEHRAAPGEPQDPIAANGYVSEIYVKALAQEQGLKFEASSEINANPKDSRDHPFGVWTLPPTRQSAPDGKPANPFFNHAKYDAIGESDRMTLRFVKR